MKTIFQPVHACRLGASLAIAGMILGGCSLEQASPEEVAAAEAELDQGGRPEIIVHRANPSTGYAPTTGSTSTVKPTIVAHGGPVMAGTPNVYVIWYGAWLDSQKLIITDFLTSVGGSNHFNINKTYPGVTGLVTYAGSVVSSYVPAAGGTAPLSDQDIQDIVGNSGLAYDANGVYFVLTGSDVKKIDFCTKYCGWHSYAAALLGGADVKFSFVGNPTACPLMGATVGNCSAQTVSSPNGDVGVDAMISVLAHELEEAVTDPKLNAWYDNRGYENADKCAWTFGTQTTAPNGAFMNVHLGLAAPAGRDFLIQRNLVRASTGNYCVKGVNGTTLIR